MFKSIRWKFITIYFLLVFIAMLIVGIFIVQKFESQQKNQTLQSMERQIENLVDYSSTIQGDNWEEEINQNTFSSWPIPITDRIYIITNSDIPKVTTTIPVINKEFIGQSVFEYKELDSRLILEALNGKEVHDEFPSNNDENTEVKHLAYPVMNEIGKVKGIIYITSDLKNIKDTIDASKSILIRATLLSLVITFVLGFLIARNITGPINDVTIKAEKMAKGDFNQYVDVKSDDEIGQLANMFNILTRKLQNTLSEMFREKSKMETIIRYMADGLIAVDTEGHIIHANPKAVEMLKIPNKEILNKKYDDIFIDLNEELTLEYVKNNNSWNGNGIIELDSSTYSAKYAPFKNERDEIGGLIIVFQDITEQYKLENMRREFVANVSHELKTPLTTIKSYTETILGGVIEDKEQSIDFLRVVDSECDRMARLVRDLLQLSNMDNKKTKWKKEYLSIDRLLNFTNKKMKISAKEKKQDVNLFIEENIPEVFADRDGIEQVILNVLSNAIKYTQEYGKIDIIAKSLEDKIIITIKDNGIGIPKEDIDRIFERFYRVDKARSRELGGTGLGLSIAKQIMESHDGDILIKSDSGTEVNIILPIENQLWEEAEAEV